MGHVLSKSIGLFNQGKIPGIAKAGNQLVHPPVAAVARQRGFTLFYFRLAAPAQIIQVLLIRIIGKLLQQDLLGKQRLISSQPPCLTQPANIQEPFRGKRGIWCRGFHENLYTFCI